MKRIALALSLLGCSSVYGAAVITTGNTQLGINDLGHLNAAGVGLNYIPVGDGIYPGCLCEGWGVSANGEVGRAAVENGGVANLSLVSFASTASTATSITSITSLPGLTITQAYAPSAATDVFRDRVTITNTTGAMVTDVRYSRSMDWDIPPTEFEELVTINRGTAASLLFSNNNGFAPADPLNNPDPEGYTAAEVNNINFVDLGPEDHGAYFTFGFGSLANNASVTFDIFYGAAPNETAALARLGTIGAEVYSFGQSNGNGTTGTPATFIFAFAGVGGDVIVPPPTGVPEPGTYAMLASGLVAVIGYRRRLNS